MPANQQNHHYNYHATLSLLMLLLLVALLGRPEAQAARLNSAPPSAELIESVRNQPPATTNAPQVAALEEPSNSESSSPRVESESEMEDIMCNGCYDNIQEAQTLLDQHNFLLEKQKNLIRKRKKSLGGAAANPKTLRKTLQQDADSSSGGGGGNSSRPHGASRTSRTVGHTQEQNSIIVSRLLVTRSARADDEERQAQAPPPPTGTQSNRFKGPKIRSYPKSEKLGGQQQQQQKKEPELENIRLKLNKAHNATCKALNAMQDCLESLSQKCYANLRFHSFEIFSDQWRSKLNCPYRNYPNVKPMRNLRSSLPNWELDEESPRPVKVRPISSDEEVGKRLDKLLAGRSRPPFGVMLKPTLTNSAVSKFQSLGAGQQNLAEFAQGGVKGNTRNRYELANLDQTASFRFEQNPFVVVTSFLVIAAILSTVAVVLMKRAIYLEDCVANETGDSENGDDDDDDEKRDINNLYATIQRH